MRAVLASVIQQYCPERYSPFLNSSELYVNDLGWEQIVPCSVSSRNRITREKSTMEGKNGYAKHT